MSYSPTIKATGFGAQAFACSLQTGRRYGGSRPFASVGSYGKIGRKLWKLNWGYAIISLQPDVFPVDLSECEYFYAFGG